MKKPWRIISTDRRMPDVINKRCSNRRGAEDNHWHAKCEGGSRTSSSASYPPALCQVWARLILSEDIEDIKILYQAMVNTEDAEDDGEGRDQDRDRSFEEAERQSLFRLHRDLGHCQNKVLAKILRAKGAEQRIIQVPRV